MTTTTVRVDVETHDKLAALAAASGTSLMEVARRAVDALERLQFGQTVAAEVAKLRLDAEAWESYLGGAEATNVSDGLG